MKKTTDRKVVVKVNPDNIGDCLFKPEKDPWVVLLVQELNPGIRKKDVKFEWA